MPSITIKKVKTLSVLSEIKHNQINSLSNNLFHPQTFNIVFHLPPLRQTSFQDPQVENLTLNGFNDILLD